MRADRRCLMPAIAEIAPCQTIASQVCRLYIQWMCMWIYSVSEKKATNLGAVVLSNMHGSIFIFGSILWKMVSVCIHIYLFSKSDIGYNSSWKFNHDYGKSHAMYDHHGHTHDVYRDHTVLPGTRPLSGDFPAFTPSRSWYSI